MVLEPENSGLVFIKPNIPALKYGREMEIKAANIFIEFIKGNHKVIKLSDCGLIVDEISQCRSKPRQNFVVFMLCNGKIKCPYSVNYIKSCYSNLEHLQLPDGKTVIKKSKKLHKVTRRGYYWNYIKKFFWTPHGMIVDELYFDNKLWSSV